MGRRQPQRRKGKPGNTKKNATLQKFEMKKSRDCEEVLKENNNNQGGTVVLTKSVSRKGEENKLTSKYVVLPTEVVLTRRKLSTIPVDPTLRDKPLFSPELETIVNLGFPIRPDRNEISSAEELDLKETEAFREWLSHIYEKYPDIYDELPAFEQNLEVWRQLWRVCEKSDLLVIVVDVRNPLLLFPVALTDYVKDKLKKPILLVLTKTDLVPESYANLWKRYFEQTFNIDVGLFSNKARSPEKRSENRLKGIRSRRKYITSALTKADKENLAFQSNRLLETCLEILKKTVPYSKFVGDNQYPTLGFVGAPNAGKSSLINCIVGKKVVSVSRTCGHTKHWQTHLIHRERDETDQIVAELCDCPGLVFPKIFYPLPSGLSAGLIKPRHVFETAGIFPIPQIRETFSAVRLLMERLDLCRLYNLKVDVEDLEVEDPKLMSPYDFLGCLGDLRGYHVTKAGEPDMHRAGIEVLKNTVDGIILLAFLPPKSWFVTNNVQIR